jgi:drug/metabolite transporter (DMT)-like permease
MGIVEDKRYLIGVALAFAGIAMSLTQISDGLKVLLAITFWIAAALVFVWASPPSRYRRS